MTLAWVIGRGGLLGSALERDLRRSQTTVFDHVGRFDWDDVASLVLHVRAEVTRFATAVGPAGLWEVYWAAGIGTMSSPAAELGTEMAALIALLAALEEAHLDPACGRFALASSAGAIYAGSTDSVIDERTPVHATTDYARAKLEQEGMAQTWAERTGVALLVSRMSTLYGVGQASAKQQGLLTHISRCLIRNQPVKIFVPLDTIRDYIAADDAAGMTIDATRALSPGARVTKIVASEEAATISEIVSIFKRLARRHPRIVTSGSSATALYKRRIQFRSIVPPIRSRPRTSLMVGVSRILAAERLRHAASAV